MDAYYLDNKISRDFIISYDYVIHVEIFTRGPVYHVSSYHA